MTRKKQTYTPEQLAAIKARMAKARAARKPRGGSAVAADVSPPPQPPQASPQEEHVFFSAGDMGDIIALLPVIRHMGGGRIIIGERSNTGTGPGFCRESMRGKRYEMLKPLLEAQPYVRGVEWGDCPSRAHDMSVFRHTRPRPGESIANWQARHLKLPEVNLDPWLRVPTVIYDAPVIFARSPRYQNPLFPWRHYADFYKNAVFVGTADEHAEFQAVIGRRIEHRITETLLDLAQLMAGSPQCICNQSAPWWVAAGVGAPTVQETNPRAEERNSMIPRARLKYVL